MTRFALAFFVAASLWFASPAFASCANECGGISFEGCYCDFSCTEIGDCCDDFGTQCPLLFAGASLCESAKGSGDAAVTAIVCEIGSSTGEFGNCPGDPNDCADGVTEIVEVLVELVDVVVGGLLP